MSKNDRTVTRPPDGKKGGKKRKRKEKKGRRRIVRLAGFQRAETWKSDTSGVVVSSYLNLLSACIRRVNKLTRAACARYFGSRLTIYTEIFPSILFSPACVAAFLSVSPWTSDAAEFSAGIESARDNFG